MKQEAGYTFIEVLIAAVIAAVIAASIIASFRVCRDIAAHNRNQLSALNFAQQKVEEIRADIKVNRFSNLTTWDGSTTSITISKGKDDSDTGDDILGITTVAITARDSAEAGVSLSSSQVAYIELTVTVGWAYLGDPYQENMVLTTMITL